MIKKSFIIPFLFIGLLFFSCNKSEPNNFEPIKSDINFPKKKAIKNNEFSERLKSNFRITKEGLKSSKQTLTLQKTEDKMLRTVLLMHIPTMDGHRYGHLFKQLLSLKQL